MRPAQAPLWPPPAPAPLDALEVLAALDVLAAEPPPAPDEACSVVPPQENERMVKRKRSVRRMGIDCTMPALDFPRVLPWQRRSLANRPSFLACWSPPPLP